jgi:type II secretory pathway pseudopilin PulG
MKLKRFSLIEVVLALLVVAVGIVGIMALFPVGLSKNKESVHARSASDAADQFLHVMASNIGAEWSEVYSLPDALPSMSESNIQWSENSILPNSNTKIQFSSVNVTDNWNPNVHQDGVFKVSQITPSNIVDFTGVIRAWKELEVFENAMYQKPDIMQGDIMPFGIIAESTSDTVDYGFDEDKSYVVKAGPQGSLAPGNYGALALGGSGANVYLNNILNGYSSLSVGQIVDSQTGNIAGPTQTGIEQRLAATPYVRIPVITELNNGKSEVEVLAFLAFKLSSVSVTANNASIEAQYLGPATIGESDGSSGDATEITLSPSYKLNLKCEISWPADLPYENRHKEIYSLKLTKVGGTPEKSSQE